MTKQQPKKIRLFSFSRFSWERNICSHFKDAIPLRDRGVALKRKGGRVNSDLGRMNVIVIPKKSF